jgi:uncharacterized protein YjbI with pentapeptide repeats
MSRAAPTTPQIDDLDLDDLRDLPAAELRAHGHHEGIRVDGADLAGADLSGLVVDEGELTGWDAHELRLTGSRLLRVRIARWTAPAIAASRVVLRGVEIDGSRFGSAEVYGSELTEVAIAGSKFGWLNLRGSELRDVRFRGCSFDELDLADAELDRVAFEDCSAGRITLTAARSRHLDLRGLEFAALEGVDGLRGALVTSLQAASLAGLLAEHVGLAIDE